MVRVAVISDTHRRTARIPGALKQLGDVDWILHLGDHASDAAALAKELGRSVIAVRGNCDPSGDTLAELTMNIAGYKLFLTHGHRYHVKYGLDRLFLRSKELDADIALFGHTHMPIVEYEEGILLLNPGSASCPRDGRNATLGLLEFEDGNVRPKILSI